MANSNTLSVDPRIISTLVCDAESGLSRFPRDTLHRVSITLNFLSELLGNGDGNLLESDDHRYAISLQLSGMASTLDALGDAIQIRKPTLGDGEVVLRFSREELEKLTLLAGRKEQSIHDVIVGIVTDKLQAFNPDRRPQ
jgi:hypothetical protein